MRKFYPLTVEEVRHETDDAVSVCFALTDENREAFRFKQGQHLILRARVDGEELRRPYSICAGVDDGVLRVAIKKIPGGVFSAYANEKLKAGEQIEVFPPTGHFYVDLDPANEKHYVAFAAGSGITPVLSLIRTTLAAEPKSRFTLFYGNRSRRSILFAEELAGIKNRYMDRFELFHFLSRDSQETELFNGRLDGDKVSELLSGLIRPDDIDEAFVCGPGDMIEGATAALQTHGVDKARIHSERFTTGVDLAASKRRARHVREETPESRINVVIEGARTSFPYDPGAGSILEAGLAAGLDLPFACKGGVCCTCRAKVLEGEVEMVQNYNLEDRDVEAGYVLTCQAMPRTDEVTVSYDA